LQNVCAVLFHNLLHGIWFCLENLKTTSTSYRSKWENNIKMDLKRNVMGSSGLDLFASRYGAAATVVSLVMKFRLL